MARFIEIRARSQLAGADNINVFWYKDEGVPLLEAADLEHYLNEFVTKVVPSLNAIRTTQNTNVDLTIQGYRDTWERAPYLPITRAWAGTGSYTGSCAPPVVAAIASCQVEPVVPGRRKDANGVITTSPVRRGYWAISGIGLAVLDVNGRLMTWNETAGVYFDARARFANSLVGPGTVGNAVPVVVSKPLKDEVLRGHGLIKSVVWRENISTRRSRKRGIGA